MDNNSMYREKKNKINISVLMPALNEECNILAAINNTLQALKDYNLNAEIIIINDGSTDKTEDLVVAVMKRDNRIRLIKHETPKGIGASFWEGIDNAKGNAVVLLPGDDENYPIEILRYYNLLEHVDIVIPFVFNKEVRSLFRNILSFIYRLIINTTFTVNFNYTNGTVLYRKSILKNIGYRSNGFFFQTDTLIRLVKKGYLFAEVPYRLGSRKGGASRAVSFPSLFQVIKGYLRLVKDYYFKPDKENKAYFPEDSITLTRRNNENIIN